MLKIFVEKKQLITFLKDVRIFVVLGEKATNIVIINNQIEIANSLLFKISNFTSQHF